MRSSPKFQTTILIEDSDWINNIQFDPRTGILDANLKNGTRYRYYGVPSTVFAHVVTSKSSGRAFNDLVKGQFQSKKLPRKKSGFYLTGR
jgi:hypothetical protein